MAVSKYTYHQEGLCVTDSTMLKNRIKQMTLEEKVGQLFTFYHSGLTYTQFAESMIHELKVGGMFLDMDSLDHAKQVHALTTAMQETSLERGSGIPLFIAADFVAGAGCKLPSGGAVYFPKNKAIGESGDEKLAYESGRITALESLAMGVNFNYSPVVDINNNPLNPVIGTHSFGEDRDVVSAMGCAVIRGYQDHSLIATAKHFPGHGDTSVDSHFDLPVLPFDRERLEDFELVPFRRAIEAGVEAVMVGHIAVPALDGSLLPASLSPRMVTGLLREELGFEGLIVTDGLSMKGITLKYTQAEACVMAIEAGVDILLAFAKTVEEARPMVEAVLDAVKSGRLCEERIEASVERIFRTKSRYGLLPGMFSIHPFSEGQLDLPEYREVSLELARRALRAIHGLKPLAGYGQLRWTLIRDANTELLGCQLVEADAVAEERVVPSYEDLTAELDRVADGEALLIACSHNKRMQSEVLKRIDRFAAERSVPVVLAHFGSAYDAEHVPHVPTLLMHDRAPGLQLAAAEYLLKERSEDDGK